MSRVFISMLVACTLAMHVTSQADPDSHSDLGSRLDSLEREIEQLTSRQHGDTWLTAERATEIRALVHDVILDADSRTSLLSHDVVAGYDKHPFLQSSDGNFRVNVNSRLQTRYVMSIQDNAPGFDTTRGGFELRRARWYLTGHVIDPSLQFRLQSNFSRAGGANLLLDAYIKKSFDNGMFVRVGQFRPGFMYESETSSGKQLAAERSLIHSTFGVARSQGIQIGRTDEWYRVNLMVHDGDGFVNAPALAFDTEFAITGKAQFLLAGNWKQFSDFTSWRGEDFAAMIGGAVHYQKAEFGTAAGPEIQDIRFTADASIEFGGWNVFGVFIYRNLDADMLTALDQFGAALQSGVMISERDEVFARYEWGDSDIVGEDELHLVTLGFTHFIYKHDLKWTTDAGYAFHAVGDTFATSGAGWRTDAPGNDGQIVVRTQLQLQF